ASAPETAALRTPASRRIASRRTMAAVLPPFVTASSNPWARPYSECTSRRGAYAARASRTRAAAAAASNPAARIEAERASARRPHSSTVTISAPAPVRSASSASAAKSGRRSPPDHTTRTYTDDDEVNVKRRGCLAHGSDREGG